MKTSNLWMTLAAATLMLAGCSNDENEPIDTWNGEIRLSSGVTVQTRANTPDTQIPGNETVYTWADKATTHDATPYIQAWTLAANGSGGFTGNDQHYPADGSKLNFYAMHGDFGSTSFTEGTSAFPASAITHSVANSQTQAADYAKSDLLYAIKKNVERSKNAVELTFYHMLSKVEVVLKSGSGSPDLDGATVTIENTKLKADFTPGKDVTMTDQSARAGMVTTTSDDNNVASITIPTVTTTDFSANTSYGAAIVVPQTIAKDASFIKVTLASGVTLSYKIPDSDLTLESGKKYIYQITVNMGELSVTSKIENWTSVSAKQGDAEMD